VYTADVYCIEKALAYVANRCAERWDCGLVRSCTAQRSDTVASDGEGGEGGVVLLNQTCYIKNSCEISYEDRLGTLVTLTSEVYSSQRTAFRPIQWLSHGQIVWHDVLTLY
jgi:hypothetical protein